MPRARKWAASESPYGPAPMMATSQSCPIIRSVRSQIETRVPKWRALGADRPFCQGNLRNSCQKRAGTVPANVGATVRNCPMTSRILIYTTMNWPSAARYAAGFVAAGGEVHAACPDNALVRVSRYVTKTHAYRPLMPLRSLRCAIVASPPDLIVACDDRAVSHLVRLPAAEMKKPGVPS